MPLAMNIQSEFQANSDNLTEDRSFAHHYLQSKATNTINASQNTSQVIISAPPCQTRADPAQGLMSTGLSPI